MKTTYLTIRGNHAYDYMIDVVDEEGATVKHIWAGLATRAEAERIIARIIACDSLMLASLRLPVGNYELREETKNVVEIIRAAQKARVARELAANCHSPSAALVAKHQARADAQRARLNKSGYRPR